MSPHTSSNVARFLELRSSEQPRATAVMAPVGRKSGSIDYEQISFSELHFQSGQISHAMLSAGICKGMRVLLMVRPGSDLIRCCFALFKIGAVPVVIDPGMGLKHFLSCVRRTQPEALVGIPLSHWLTRLFRSAFRSIRIRIQVGNAFDRWYACCGDSDFPIAMRGPHDLAAILFTSGSTGPPKGVCYGHGQFDAQVRLVRETFEIEPGEVDLPMLPVFALFNPALGMCTVVPEMNPGKPSKADPSKLAEAIRQCEVTNSFGSPVLWRKLSRFANHHRQVFPTMRRILMAGAPVPPGLVEELKPCFPHARLWSPYGATECLPVTAIDGETIRKTSAQKTIHGKGTCVGKPVAGVSVRIIRIVDQPIQDMADAEEVSSGEIGEIIATGPSVTHSYDALPDATRRAKIREGSQVWHRMGDAGYICDDGYLWFCGRIAERVHTPDGIVYTDCCEGIFNTLPGVARSALIGLGKAPDQQPAIAIEPEPGCKVNRQEVLALAARHEVSRSIKSVFFIKSFPVDVRHNAKIHRLELARRYNRS